MDRTVMPNNKSIFNTTYGRIRGTIDDGVYTYLGIDYAKASERFVPAEKDCKLC